MVGSLKCHYVHNFFYHQVSSIAFTATYEWATRWSMVSNAGLDGTVVNGQQGCTVHCMASFHSPGGIGLRR